MSYFRLNNNGLDNGVQEYAALNNLRRIMDRNNDRFIDYIHLGNRVLENQNPLVTFIQLFSVNVEWSQEYLINVIKNNVQHYASEVNFTSLYNKGKDHIGSIYPEADHHTLLVVPFGNPSPEQIDAYFSIPLNELIPFYPIYSTDYIQRWDIMEMIDTRQRKNGTELFSIVQIDPWALLIGYYRWLKSDREYGNSPHGYLAAYPLMNCYLYHNELVNYNYLNGQHEKINVIKGYWTLEPYFVQLTEYTGFKHKKLLGTMLKSFRHFYRYNRAVNPIVDQTKFLFPPMYKSGMFVQLNWVWSLASLGMAKHYLQYMNFVGAVDGTMSNDLDMYFTKVQLQNQLNQIKSEPWKKHFNQVWNDVKKLK